MASKKLALVTEYGVLPDRTWMYECDTEADVASLPDECTMCLVLTHDDNKSPVRARATDGSWKEVK